MKSKILPLGVLVVSAVCLCFAAVVLQRVSSLETRLEAISVTVRRASKVQERARDSTTPESESGTKLVSQQARLSENPDATKSGLEQTQLAQLVGEEYRRLQQEEAATISMHFARAFVARGFVLLETTIRQMGLAPSSQDVIGSALKAYKTTCERLGARMLFETDGERVTALRKEYEQSSEEFLLRIQPVLSVDQMEGIRRQLPAVELSPFPLDTGGRRVELPKNP